VAYIPRIIETGIREDLSKKMVFVSGPGQAGKTTLARRLLTQTGSDIDTAYFNRDSARDRERILRLLSVAGKPPYFKTE